MKFVVIISFSLYDRLDGLLARGCLLSYCWVPDECCRLSLLENGIHKDFQVFRNILRKLR